ncbi:hypothetical protein KIL84_001670 [Mauremys mutica]|uniref:Ig-like domain-containing protein n=1 Tax=Mauremys mutica TaxID=74926 RepID=A0A9D4B4Z2_9SAUR|nr:hypothetical protein KIL84_001670 [Mauremys mutica]
MVSALTVLFLCCWLVLWSEVSGKLPAPGLSISVSPSGVIALGGAVTIRCQCRSEARRLFLYKDGIQIRELDAGGEYTISIAGHGDRGFYSCRSHSSSEPTMDPRDYVRIVVAELSSPKPSISLSPRGGVALGGTVTIRCECRCQNVTVLMYKLGNLDVRRWAETAGGVAEFTIDNVSRRDTGSYSCQYGTKSDPPVWSHPSDPVELMVAGGSETSAASVLTGPIIAGVSAAAAGLLLLLGILCRRRSQGRKGLASRESRESEAAATVDTLMGQGKQLDVLPQEPSTEGLTYAELDLRTLQAKPGGLAPAPEPVLYAAINVSQVPHGQPQERKFPKPSLSVSPQGETEPGENVIFRCVGGQPGMRFVLYRSGHPVNTRDPSGNEAEFPIPSVGPGNRGTYTCRYYTISQTPDWSEPSDPVELMVAELSYSKPTISLCPSGGVTLGGAVTVRCRGRHQNVRFLLYKDGNRNVLQDTEPAGDVAEFPISNVSPIHGGSYSCYYHSKSDPPVWSHPSDPMELVLADPGLPRPSISLSPTGVTAPGADITIRCQGQRRDVSFFLHKAGDLNPQRHMDPAGAGAEFHILTVGRQQGGSYSCSYQPRSQPFVSSQPSDPVELVVADPGLPRPSISLSPTGVTAPGADVTIRCQGQRWDVRFFLHKAGDLNLQRHMDPAGAGAEFRILTVGRQHGGSYSCSYQPRSEPFVSSQPSNPMQLVVADPGLPRPSISLSPTGVTAPGADVTIRCQGQRRDVRFFLHKAGDLNPQRHMDPAGAGAEFRIPSVGRQHGGSYSCSYRPRSEPFVSSQPSDPVELVVADYTQGNIIRLALGAGVLLSLALILAEAAPGWRRGCEVTVTPSEVMPHRQDRARRTSAAEPV